MADFPTTARVVIIGGGVVGVSALYHLAKAGWSDCVLLEKNELTAGSTWHAAGNVPTFSTSWSLMNMQRYSTELYRGLGEAVDYPMNYHVTGSIRLAHSKERMQEFQRAKGMGLYQGMEIDILSPDEIRAKYPFIETHDLKGALYDPADGDIDPAQLTQALAKGARDLGATIGGEGNGGVILPEMHLGRDAPVGAALLLQLMLEEARPLSEVIAERPKYVIVKDKLDRPEAPLDA